MVCCNHELLKQLGSLIKMYFFGLSKSALNSIEIKLLFKEKARVVAFIYVNGLGAIKTPMAWSPYVFVQTMNYS